ncbi:hypothetical protein PK35_08655 [Tamlana nanhaiensis]|uniref:DUF4878 domain-containing protein n=1 Tax=Neotamlana nanhaiensis TaxID=1382798 RepID=A0A0D7W2U2_9FLAO|nr:hypothetical protein [Tamlana nanhaiensis]KJD33028.1 hypothetical protein PK35_08655 [Tamlana nanhaiensis]
MKKYQVNIKMKFLKVWFLTLILCFSIAGFSQSDASEVQQIKEIANAMLNDVATKNYDALIDKMHPKVFSIVPKESLKEVFKSTFEGNGMLSIDMSEEKPEFKISDIFNVHDTLKYAFISYDMKMKMTFKDQEFDEASQDMMKNMMKAKGMDVNFITNNTLDVLANNSMTIALKDKASNNQWTVLNYDADSPLVYQILPSELLEKAKYYKQDLMLESKKKSE